MTHRAERLWPGAVAVAVTGLAGFAAGGHETRIAEQLANPVLTMVSICIGFLAAAVTILLTAPIPAVKQLARCPDHFVSYVGYHWSAMLWGFLSAMFCLLLIALDALSGGTQQASALFSVAFLGWVFCTVLAFATLFRVVYLLRILLQTLSHT